MEFLIKILPGIITAILGSYLAAKWSLNKYYSEKWWDRKEHAYSEIISALYDVIQYCEIQKEDYGQGTGIPSAKMKELSLNYTAAYWKIKKATDIGAFVISEKALEALKELSSRPQLVWEENPPWDIFEEDYNAHKKALKELIEITKRDLGTKNV